MYASPDSWHLEMGQVRQLYGPRHGHPVDCRRRDKSSSVSAKLSLTAVLPEASGFCAHVQGNGAITLAEQCSMDQIAVYIKPQG